MRYTTLIDISEIPAVYRNPNARLLYLHMALKADYRGESLDLARLSLHQLAAGSGLTVSAVRHGLKILQSVGLIKREGEAWRVTKWLVQEPARKRPKNAQEARQIDAAAVRTVQNEEADRRRAMEREQRDKLLAMGHTPLTYLYEQKQAAARQGDQDAAAFCERQKATYDQHVKSLIEKGIRKP